ncbi:MAG: penicillin-binding protein 2 [Zetaproteobacteria bacterium CG_4_9_14_3_um_filter_49_83]|nr:MAG: penicillin-binding protein 2 [Zetaproteobacteria bacterium CG1_02_49_23]PIQ30021.1 MAG: penicillin-binding protein 2 [Zetaproteobacteria bacterium CG17_big_fil_post_rev_8_21_14_2_50_50_13]PIV30640.1 MAG: penicillin-binding protein 2 [Zetaproteobacteria bacterium CG02_land_8_20_14_3_00_50_9]PIY56031.1 MAG: penicillin-binding protein 2 [Zetaproteobacteria bacterium CG_4_10_14_0_8_um_filter_49_80]PJA36292.1 MAG: penicillin-binding protein 2 [Zetaproteobacteria bacterium CG_4_9_14_3_um_filt
MNQLEIRARYDVRILVLKIGTFILLAFLLARITNLQWIQHDQLVLQSDMNRLNIVPILPTRGIITDRRGLGLAVNNVSYRIEIIPERVDDIASELTALSALIGWSDKKTQRMIKTVEHSRKDRPFLLEDKLPWQRVAELSARLHRHPGINVKAGTHRFYPFAELTSHVLGYLAIVRDADIEKGYLRNEYVGRSGLERAFEQRLHGKPGSQQEEVDAHGRRIAVLAQTPPEMGESLTLSLDVEVQQAASDALGERTGAVVVMDVNTGQILTLLSKPGYDTNQFTLGLEQQQWNEWLHDIRKPLLNRVTQAAYPPASTWKLISSFAGLRQNLALAHGHTQCKGYLELADRQIRCWKQRGHGRVDLQTAIQQSCDVYYYELGDKLGMEPMMDEARRWGFGQKTGIILSPESKGHLSEDLQTLHNGRKRPWYRGINMITAIGQGSTTVTPLQMARFAAAIANGGRVLKPHLLFGEVPGIEREVNINEHDLQLVRQGMFEVTSEIHGTAYNPLRHTPWTVAGKTGTAQVIMMAEDATEKNTRIPEKNIHKDHAWFMGFAPFDHPKIAFAIFVEHGGHGGSAAAPVAKAVIEILAARESEQ